MTSQELRLSCLDRALQFNPGIAPDQAIKVARQYEEYVRRIGKG